jgi:hypothetical protein
MARESRFRLGLLRSRGAYRLYERTSGSRRLLISEAGEPKVAMSHVLFATLHGIVLLGIEGRLRLVRQSGSGPVVAVERQEP